MYTESYTCMVSWGIGGLFITLDLRLWLTPEKDICLVWVRGLLLLGDRRGLLPRGGPLKERG